MLSKLVTAATAALSLLAFAPVPAGAQGTGGWQALCVPGNEVEILIGSEWYRGIVTGPNRNGEVFCNVTTTAYTGNPMHFEMAPERMRSVQVPGVAGPATGPAPKPGDVPREQQAWRAICVAGSEVEILIGGAWYKGVVIGPDEYGDDASSSNSFDQSAVGSDKRTSP